VKIQADTARWDNERYLDTNYLGFGQYADAVSFVNYADAKEIASFWSAGGLNVEVQSMPRRGLRNPPVNCLAEPQDQDPT
jgi:hypothetical protein